LSTATALTRDTQPGREYGLDWLRVFAFSVLIFYHSGMAFVTWDWHLKNPEQSTTLEYVMLACNRWRLPLLFFISGAGVYFSLRRRSVTQFSAERIRRLLLPLVVGMFVVVPPQIYLERIHNGAQFTFPEFYRTVFDFVPYPEGSFSWHHLWFLAYILVYSLVCIPVFRALRGASGQRAIDRAVSGMEAWPVLLYLINVPNLLVGVFLGPHWPTTHNLVADWANFTGSLLTFLWGFTIASNRRFLDLITRRRNEFVIAGIAVAVLFFIARGYRFHARLASVGPAVVSGGPERVLRDDLDLRHDRLCARLDHTPNPLAAVCDGGSLSVLHLSPDDHRCPRIRRHRLEHRHPGEIRCRSHRNIRGKLASLRNGPASPCASALIRHEACAILKE
jgi:hypothetical protein